MAIRLYIPKYELTRANLPMLQPIDRPLFWALVAVAVVLAFAALVGTGMFDQWSVADSISQPVMSLIAALIGGSFALSGVIMTHFLTSRRAKKQEAIVNRRYLKALLDELLTAWNSYHEDIGGDVENLPSGQAMEWHYPIFESLLPVYHGNIGTILNIEDDTLRRQIVKTCTSFMTFMDCFRFNNALLVDCETAEAKKRFDHANDPRLADEVDRCQKRIAAYGTTIRNGHTDVKSNIETLRISIDRATRWGDVMGAG